MKVHLDVLALDLLSEAWHGGRIPNPFGAGWLRSQSVRSLFKVFQLRNPRSLNNPPRSECKCDTHTYPHNCAAWPVVFRLLMWTSLHHFWAAACVYGSRVVEDLKPSLLLLGRGTPEDAVVARGTRSRDGIVWTHEPHVHCQKRSAHVIDGKWDAEGVHLPEALIIKSKRSGVD